MVQCGVVVLHIYPIFTLCVLHRDFYVCNLSLQRYLRPRGNKAKRLEVQMGHSRNGDQAPRSHALLDNANTIYSDFVTKANNYACNKTLEVSKEGVFIHEGKNWRDYPSKQHFCLSDHHFVLFG